MYKSILIFLFSLSFAFSEDNSYSWVKKIDFNTSEFEGLEISNLAKIICVISPLDYLIKQMLLEFDNEDDLCKNLLSVLEIENVKQIYRF